MPTEKKSHAKKSVTQKISPIKENPDFVHGIKPEKTAKTKVTVHYNCGFGNILSIRGEGISTLSWEKGVPLKNKGPSEWVFETNRPFSVASFKIMLNDTTYENGENHIIGYGQETAVTPQF